MTLTLKDVPDDLHARIKERAARHRRSLNREAIACLEAAVAPRVVDVDALLARARALRHQVKGRLSQRDLRAFRRQGRA